MPSILGKPARRISIWLTESSLEEITRIGEEFYIDDAAVIRAAIDHLTMLSSRERERILQKALKTQPNTYRKPNVRGMFKNPHNNTKRFNQKEIES